jgi:hypothetical protein
VNTARHVEIPRIVLEVLVGADDVGGLAETTRRVRRLRTLLRDLGERNREIAQRLFSRRDIDRAASILRGAALRIERQAAGASSLHDSHRQAKPMERARLQTEGHLSVEERHSGR